MGLPMQKHINRPVLILAPLGVIGQTIKEGEHFGYEVKEIGLTVFDQDLKAGIYITNYDNMENIDAYLFGGVVLDESSILKNFAGKTRTALIEDFKDTPYKYTFEHTYKNYFKITNSDSSNMLNKSALKASTFRIINLFLSFSNNSWSLP